MKLLIPFRKRDIKSGSSSAERSNAADKSCFIAVSFHAALKISKSRVNTGISQCQKNNIFSFIKNCFQCLGASGMIAFQFLRIMSHGHINGKKFLFCQFRYCLHCNLVGNRIFRLRSRYSYDFIFADQTHCLQSHQLRISRAYAHTV